MKIWAKTEEFSEGKYLVVRRDGTTPTWPHFVIGGDDPCAPEALLAYAREAERRGFDADYVASIEELAEDFRRRTGGKADPDKGPHRIDLALAIAMMRRETSVWEIAADIDRQRGKLQAARAEVRRLIEAMRRALDYVSLGSRAELTLRNAIDTSPREQ